MINQRYRKYESSNMINGKLDLSRRDKIRAHMIQTTFPDYVNKPLPQEVVSLMDNKIQSILDPKNGPGGVCAGMVCLWAHDFLHGSVLNPQKPNPPKAATLQGKYWAKIASSQIRKPDLDLEGVKTKSLKKMYMGVGLFLSDQPRTGAFPQQPGFYEDRVVKQLVAFLDQSRLAPHTVSCTWSMGGARGQHALGIAADIAGKYVIFDPNHGLYGLPDRQTFISELGNHFRQHAVPNSMWTLHHISHAQPDLEQIAS